MCAQGRQTLLSLLCSDFDAVLRWQDEESGLWYQVMDAPARDGNYLESSCSSMFVYAMLKAVNRGWVGEQYRRPALKAYDAIVRHFVRVDADHTISLTRGCAVAGLGPGSSSEVLAALERLNPAAKLKENRRRDGSYSYYLSEPVRDNDSKAVGPFIFHLGFARKGKDGRGEEIRGIIAGRLDKCPSLILVLTIPHLSFVYRSSIGHLSSIYRASIGNLSEKPD